VLTPIILTLVGFLLLVAEVFFVSMGLFGLVAAGFIVAADVVAFQHSPGLMWVLIGVQIVAIPLIVKGAFAVLPHLPFGRGMILGLPKNESSSGVEASGHLLGREGVALSELRPSGLAQLGEERRSVVLESGTAAAGTPLVVVAVEGYRVVVRPAGARPA
jgi:membrane-bound serine protease (ClpP class)